MNRLIVTRLGLAGLHNAKIAGRGRHVADSAQQMRVWLGWSMPTTHSESGLKVLRAQPASHSPVL